MAGVLGIGALLLLTDVGNWSLRSAAEEPSDDEVDPLDGDDNRTGATTTPSTEPTSTAEAPTTTASTTSTAPAVNETAPIEIIGDPLAPMPPDIRQTDSATDSSYGQLAPTLAATDVDGNEVTIGPDGRAKVIYFLAHWCPHCQREAPVVQQLVEDGEVPAGLDVYAVSTAVEQSRGNWPASAWLRDEVGFTSPVVRDDDLSSALLAFGNGGFPFAIYLDSNHRVVARSSGELGADAIVRLWQQATVLIPEGVEEDRATDSGDGAGGAENPQTAEAIVDALIAAAAADDRQAGRTIAPGVDEEIFDWFMTAVPHEFLGCEIVGGRQACRVVGPGIQDFSLTVDVSSSTVVEIDYIGGG